MGLGVTTQTVILAALYLVKGIYGAPLNTTRRSLRRLQSDLYYFSTSDAAVLGAANTSAAIGNPLKGLYTSPRWTGGTPRTNIPDTIDFYFVGLDEVMTGPSSFDWSFLDGTIATAVARQKHVAWRMVCHYDTNLRLPQYLIDAKVPLVPTPPDGLSPHYGHALMLRAFESFIAAFGQRYDGNEGIAFIQLGLLGKWGEWHTVPQTNIITSVVRDKVIELYAAAFAKTQLQIRGPMKTAIAAGMGLHDDQFAFHTLGDDPDFFWPIVQRGGHTDFWKKGIMGGQTWPGHQSSIFETSYPAVGVDAEKQNFLTCATETHSSAVFHHKDAFDGLMSGPELANAREAHARLGYNFQVTKVSASVTANKLVQVDVTVQQTGIAPFYYPLRLVLTCPDMTPQQVNGVETLIARNSSNLFSFKGLSSNRKCLDDVMISLQSPHVTGGKHIKFAQSGTINGNVKLKIPVPEERGQRRPCFLRRMLNRLLSRTRSNRKRLVIPW